MTTKAEAITAAIFNLLTAPTALAGGNVYRSRIRKVPEDNATAIVVRQGADVRVGESTLAKTQRQISVATEIYARGDVPDQLADPLVEAVMIRLMADRTLDGLCDDILPGNRTPEWAARDTDLVVIDLEFVIDYEVFNEEL